MIHISDDGNITIDGQNLNDIITQSLNNKNKKNQINVSTRVIENGKVVYESNNTDFDSDNFEETFENFPNKLNINVKNQDIECQYCGLNYNIKSKKCPNCGAVNK